MVPKKNQLFYIIDDSKLDCYIAEKVLQKIAISTTKSFLLAQDALEYLVENPLKADQTGVIFLDENMHYMNGFQFLDAFTQKFDEAARSKYAIHMVTSDENAPYHPLVKRLLHKPITEEKIRSLTHLFI